VIGARRAGTNRACHGLLARVENGRWKGSGRGGPGVRVSRTHSVQSAFRGDEVVSFSNVTRTPARHYRYRLLATSKTSTLEKELLQAGAAGYQVVGMALAQTAFGGKELVAILRRAE
jgi:hypothetical protein